MPETTTREKALQAALELSGRKGCDSVSMNDIAEAVGIRAPSLYKHFAGKEALFAAAATTVWEHYRTLWQDVGDALEGLERDAHGPGTLNAERLEGDTLAWVEVELERGAGFRAFARQSAEGLSWLWDRPLALYESSFSRLMERQTVKRADAHIMALEYLAPILQLIELSDLESTRRPEAEEEIRKHIRQFCRAFAVKERPAASAPPARGLFRR